MRQIDADATKEFMCTGNFSEPFLDRRCLGGHINLDQQMKVPAMANDPNEKTPFERFCEESIFDEKDRRDFLRFLSESLPDKKSPQWLSEEDYEFFLSRFEVEERGYLTNGEVYDTEEHIMDLVRQYEGILPHEVLEDKKGKIETKVKLAMNELKNDGFVVWEPEGIKRGPNFDLYEPVPDWHPDRNDQLVIHIISAEVVRPRHIILRELWIVRLKLLIGRLKLLIGRLKLLIGRLKYAYLWMKLWLRTHLFFGVALASFATALGVIFPFIHTPERGVLVFLYMFYGLVCLIVGLFRETTAVRLVVSLIVAVPISTGFVFSAWGMRYSDNFLDVWIPMMASTILLLRLFPDHKLDATNEID